LELGWRRDLRHPRWHGRMVPNRTQAPLGLTRFNVLWLSVYA
jgi:hypothetical protein